MTKTLTDETIAAYDRIAPEYGKVNFNHFWINEFEFFKNMVPGKKILDIGCGAGRDASVFIHHGFDYTGIDASSGMLKVASARVPTAKFLLMDFYKLDFPLRTFDGFWAAASLLHIPKKKVLESMQSIRNLLKPGGAGFISMKAKKDMSEDELVVHSKKYGGAGRFFALYKQEEFQKLIEQSGFKVAKVTVRYEDDEDKTEWLCYFVKNE